MSFFDTSLWIRAGWSATTYRWHPTSDAPPVMGIVFGNDNIGQQIFLNWIGEFGNKDELDAIRVSIVEGDIPNMRPGYSVHISPDPINLIAHATAQDTIVTEGDELQLRSLVCRAHPIPGTPPMLPKFKREVAKHNEYMLAPVTHRDDGKLWFDVELGIIKRTIHFRQVSEIEADDIDAPVLNSNG